MWTILIIIALFVLIVFNLIRVMIYGKSIIKPDFARVDEKMTEKTGFTSHWNTTFSKIVYYVFLIGLVGFLIFIVSSLFS